jgi:hypothetical protein
MAGTSKVRLVVGLFGAAKELASGLAELGARGARPSQINLVAQADAFRGALADWQKRGEARGFAGWIVYRPVDGAVPWSLGAAGMAASTAAENDARALLGFHHWALRRQAQLLHRHLQEGGALLLVEPHTDAEERAACTALLRYASGGVQTHEITRSREG